MIATLIWGFTNSNADDYKKIYDSSGNACGFDKTKDYPVLYVQNFSSPYKTVCIKQCLHFDYNAIKYNLPYSPDDNRAADPNGYPGFLGYRDFASKFGGLSHT
jgi:hypothetical protein